MSTPEWLGAIRDSPSLSVTVDPSITAVQRAYDRDAFLEPLERGLESRQWGPYTRLAF